MAKHWPDEQESHRRQSRRMRGHRTLKSETCTEGVVVYAAGISVKVSAHYPRRTPPLLGNKLASQRCGRGRNVRRFINETLNPVLRRWTNYFRLSQTKTFARELDEWLRHRLRCVIWRQWKRPHTRDKKLVQLGLKPERARKSSSNGRGPWYTSGALNAIMHYVMVNNYKNKVKGLAT